MTRIGNPKFPFKVVPQSYTMDYHLLTKFKIKDFSMKKLNFLPLIAVLMLFFAAPNYAQKNVETNVTTNISDGEKTVTVIKKYIDENGVETTEETTEIITIDEGSDNRFYFNSDDNDVQVNIDDIQSLSNEINEQLAELEIELGDGNETVHIFRGNVNGKNSSCNSNPVPFLGVVTKSTENGALIKEVVDGSAAKAAGLQVGDKITSVGGKSTNKTSELSCAIKKQTIGENVTVNYIRNGQSMSTTAKLTARKDTRTTIITRSNWDNYANNFQRGNNRSYSYSSNYKVDPCKVFIGVFTSTNSHRSSDGLTVNGVIEDTPAEEAGLQQGDIIIAMDGVNVNNHKELLNQRGTHSQGDQFTLTYKRNGQYYTVGAEFKSCKEEPSDETPAEIVVDTRDETPQAFAEMDTELDIELRAFPNPSNRLINVRFEGDAVPTTVSITDINGKEVYRDYNRNFDGIYNERIDLRELGAAQGTVIITVTQNGKATSEKLLYIQGRA